MIIGMSHVSRISGGFSLEVGAVKFCKTDCIRARGMGGFVSSMLMTKSHELKINSLLEAVIKKQQTLDPKTHFTEFSLLSMSHSLCAEPCKKART